MSCNNTYTFSRAKLLRFIFIAPPTKLNDVKGGRNYLNSMVVSCAKSAFHGTLFRSIVVKGLELQPTARHHSSEKQRKKVGVKKGGG